MSNDELKALAVQERRDYANSWRRKNKDKVRGYNEAYWKKRVLAKLQAAQGE